MNKKIIFETYCDDFLFERFGCKKLINSLKYFHPGIDIVYYNTQEINKIHKEYNVNYNNALPCFMLDAKRKTNADFVCHIDSDSICLEKLDEILLMNYNIASCRNNNDGHIGDEKHNRPRDLWNLPNNKYVSCGCLSTNSEKFLLEWNDLNQQIIRIYGGVKTFWMCDQNMMNILFHSGKYETKILDQTGTNLYYGSSANMYSGGKSEYIQTDKDPAHIIKEWGVNNWQSWRETTYNNGEFFLHGRKVKILHWAGGGSAKTAIKLSFDVFDLSIVPILQKITKCEK